MAAEPTPVRIAQFDDDRAAAITYTFDDNLRDQYTIAVPMLNEAGFKGTFFVIPGQTVGTVEEAEKRMAEKRTWGSIIWSEMKKMSDEGHEIASHTWSHPQLTKLTPEDVEADFSKADDAIKANIGKAPLTLAFPYNSSTPEIQAVALKHYVAYRSYQMGTGPKSTVESLNTWADQQVKEKKWGVMMLHGIVAGYSPFTDPEIFRQHLKYVKSREKEIWVDTFARISLYKKERESAKLTVTENAGVITCDLTSSLDPQIYNVPLTLVIESAGVSSASAKREGKELPVRVANGFIYIKAVPAAQPITITR